MNAVESTVQLQIRMPSSLRQAVKIEAAMREVRVCRFVQEAIQEKIARDRAAAVPTEPAAVAQ
jgi:predicted HicB family RNase H-like nuclease